MKRFQFINMQMWACLRQSACHCVSFTASQVSIYALKSLAVNKCRQFVSLSNTLSYIHTYVHICGVPKAYWKLLNFLTQLTQLTHIYKHPWSPWHEFYGRFWVSQFAVRCSFCCLFPKLGWLERGLSVWQAHQQTSKRESEENDGRNRLLSSSLFSKFLRAKRVTTRTNSYVHTLMACAFASPNSTIGLFV